MYIFFVMSGPCFSCFVWINNLTQLESKAARTIWIEKGVAALRPKADLRRPDTWESAFMLPNSQFLCVLFPCCVHSCASHHAIDPDRSRSFKTLLSDIMNGDTINDRHNRNYLKDNEKELPPRGH